MSNLLHIKDSYYFEVPKFMWRSHRESLKDFPDYWVKLDSGFQDWEAEKLIDALVKEDSILHNAKVPSKSEILSSYHAWRGQDKNFAKPLERYLEESKDAKWFQERIKDEQTATAWKEFRQEFHANTATLEKYKENAPEWSTEKLKEYNHQLDGKILIPQPFGELKNNYEAASGFCISKFMIIELVVAMILVVLFVKLAGWMSKSEKPKGKLWNALEGILLYFRDYVTIPAIGKKDAARFTPLLWTIFLFILGCNLFGLLPWMGSPTASFAVTIALALVTFVVGLIFGSKKFGVLGYWKNLVPDMGLPWYMAIPITALLFPIEVMGLLIKHSILGVRLLANMVAGHLVLLAIMGLAVAAAGSSSWGMTAGIAIIGSTLICCLELFVAFLQAYVFTFLSALFIGSAIHKH